jgi:hypothetical protein
MEYAVCRVNPGAGVAGVRFDMRPVALFSQADIRPRRGGRHAELQQREEE